MDKIILFIKRYSWLVLVVFVIGFGTIEYFNFYLLIYPDLSHVKLLSNSFYSAIKLFGISTEISELNLISLRLEWIRWIAVAASGLTFLKALEFFFTKHFQRLRNRVIGGHYVVIGLNKSTSFLIQDLIAHNDRVILIEPDSGNTLLNDYNQNQITTIIGNPTELSIMNSMCLKKATAIIIYTTKDAFNIEIAAQLNVYLNRKIKGSNRQVSCKIHILNKEYEQIIDDKIISGDQQSRLDIQIFNGYSNSVQMLFSEHPLYQNRPKNTFDNRPIHIVILGFGKMGERVLLQSLNLGHFKGHHLPKITIIDTNAKQLEAWFLSKFPHAKKACDLTFLDHDVTSYSMNQELSETYHSADYIVVTFSDDDFNFQISSYLSRSLKDIPIAVRISKDFLFGQWLNEDVGHYNQIYTFGSLKNSFSKSSIIHDSLDGLAKDFHQSYCTINHSSEKWENISIFKRESNRAQVHHIETKLHSVGLCIKKIDELIPSDEIIESKSDYLDWIGDQWISMAHMEHNRWCSFYFINNWTTQLLHLENDEFNKLNVCLVPWESLDKISEIKQKDFKKYNVNFVFNLYDYLSSGNYAICKLKLD